MAKNLQESIKNGLRAEKHISLKKYGIDEEIVVFPYVDEESIATGVATVMAIVLKNLGGSYNVDEVGNHNIDYIGYKLYEAYVTVGLFTNVELDTEDLMFPYEIINLPEVKEVLDNSASYKLFVSDIGNEIKALEKDNDPVRLFYDKAYQLTNILGAMFVDYVKNSQEDILSNLQIVLTDLAKEVGVPLIKKKVVKRKKTKEADIKEE